MQLCRMAKHLWIPLSQKKKKTCKGRYRQAGTPFLVPKSSLIFYCCITNYHKFSNLKHYCYYLTVSSKDTHCIQRTLPHSRLRIIQRCESEGAGIMGAILEFCFYQHAIDTFGQEKWTHLERMRWVKGQAIFTLLTLSSTSFYRIGRGMDFTGCLEWLQNKTKQSRVSQLVD